MVKRKTTITTPPALTHTISNKLTALHMACKYDAPPDIIVYIVKLNSQLV